MVGGPLSELRGCDYYFDLLFCVTGRHFEKLGARGICGSGDLDLSPGGLDFGWSQMSGRRTSGSSRTSLGGQVFAVFSFIS